MKFTSGLNNNHMLTGITEKAIISCLTNLRLIRSLEINPLIKSYARKYLYIYGLCTYIR